MFAAVLATLLVCQSAKAPEITLKEDPIDHGKSLTLALQNVLEKHHFEMELLFHRDGQELGPTKPTDKVTIHFSSIATEWKFLDYRKVVLADGGSSIDLGSPKHRGKTMKGGVMEQILTPMKFADLERLASQPKFRGKVGTQMFELSPDQMEALRGYVKRLKEGEVDRPVR